MGDTANFSSAVLGPFLSVQARAGYTSAGATGELRLTGPYALSASGILIAAPTVSISDTFGKEPPKVGFGLELASAIPAALLWALRSPVLPLVVGTVEIDTNAHLRASAGVELVLGKGEAKHAGFSISVGWQNEQVNNQAANGAYLGFRGVFF